jgi:hypothetical protein
MKQTDKYDAPVSFMFFVQMKVNGNRHFFFNLTLGQAMGARGGVDV